MPPNTLATSVDLDRPQSTSDGTLHKPAFFKDLGLLTNIFGKSVSRRFSWCNSQLLTPSGRRAMKETVFVPSPATPGENRLRSILALRGDKFTSTKGCNVFAMDRKEKNKTNKMRKMFINLFVAKDCKKIVNQQTL